MPEFEPVGYEQRDASPRGVAWTAVGLAVVIFFSFVGIYAFEASMARHRGVEMERRSSPNQDIPAPRLQADPAVDLVALRANEDARLHTYGWVDRKAGVVHIPIERAMDLLLDRGLPVRPQQKEAAR